MTDDEMRDRVERHRNSRPSGWVTYECPKDMNYVFDTEKHDCFLVDCMTVYLANFIYDAGGFENADYFRLAEIENMYTSHLEKIIASVKNNNAITIMVTNETGSGIVPESLLARVFRDMAGRANQYLAEAADEVYLCVSGIPVKIKGDK